MICPRCGKDNEPGNLFCGKCGIEMSTVAPAPPEPDEVKFCYRHKKTSTLLSCGRCERPICTKCAIIGPAGPRCPDCARQNVKVTARGLAHDLKMRFSGLGRQGPYAIYLYVMIAVMLLGALRGCVFRSGSRVEPGPRYERTQDPAPE